MQSVLAEAPPITARDDGALLRDLVTLLAIRPDLLPRAAQAVASSLHRPDHAPQVFVDMTGADNLADAAELAPAVLVDVQVAGERSQLVQRSEPPTLLDLRPGDTLVVARAENAADAQLRPVYEAAQAHGVRLAVPLSSSDALVDALALLGVLDAGIFCADDRTHRAAARASEGRDIAVHRVNGKDVRKATVAALTKVGQ
jgi:hypothetical protein